MLRSAAWAGSDLSGPGLFQIKLFFVSLESQKKMYNFNICLFKVDNEKQSSRYFEKKISCYFVKCNKYLNLERNCKEQNNVIITLRANWTFSNMTKFFGEL